MVNKVSFLMVLMVGIGFAAAAQSKTPFDTLQVDSSDFRTYDIMLNSKQQEAIKIMNTQTKDYVIRVYAEEKPGTLIFKGRMEDIVKHRDYKLSRILDERQYKSFTLREID